MSDYPKKRMEYINAWPDVSLFAAEETYQTKCKNFKEINHKNPFMPMKIWFCEDDLFNRAISHLIDSLDVMPEHPNFAFMFMFSGLDVYSKEVYNEKNTTASLKKVCNDLAELAQMEPDAAELLENICAAIPYTACQYFYRALLGWVGHNKNVKSRVTQDEKNQTITDHDDLVREIFNKYGMPSDHLKNPEDMQKEYREKMRKPSALYRIIFKGHKVTVGATEFSVSLKCKLYFLLLGIVYSLRNSAMHGSSMASTKSSKTTLKRYALNYYCYLAVYTVFMLFLILKSDMEIAEKRQQYTLLKEATEENVDNFKLLFGNQVE